MDIFLIGLGKVGTAISNFLKKRNVEHKILQKVPENVSGILFLAVSDSAVSPLLSEILEKNPELFVVHFSAATHFEDNCVFLLHPYSSINKRTELSQILFTLWGDKKPVFEEMLNKTGLNFVYCGKNPGPLYHASAVISGNFTQFFVLQASALLEKSGFTKEDSEKLLRQLVNSSLDNIFLDGKNGITGPASRGENEVLSNEYNALNNENSELALIFKAVNEAISRFCADK